tara:strand:+ start:104 stop:1399 length:1296 start_codon:yes stop_codon:yes gene_type:complete
MFRSFEFVKRLPSHGIRPIVLTLEPSKKFFDRPQNPKLLEELPDEVEIYRLSDRHYKIPKTKLGWFLRIFFRTMRDDDLYTATRRQAKELIQSIRKKHAPQAVIVSIPPFSGSELALDAVDGLECPLIADFRDGWSQWETNMFQTKWHCTNMVRLERRFVGRASSVITVTPELTRLFERTNGHAKAAGFHTIANGHQIDFDQPTESDADVRKPDHVWKIGYVGTYYYNPDLERLAATPWYRRPLGKQLQYSPLKEEWIYRSPNFFLRALGAFIEKNPEYEKRIEFHHVGDVPPWLNEMAEEFGVKDNCVFHGFVPKPDAMKLIEEFDGFLCTSMRREDGGDYCLASKTFDYLRFRKPLLGFVCDGTQKNFLLKSGCSAVCDPDDLNEGVSVIEDFVNGKISTTPTADFLRGYHLDELTQQLAEVVKGVTAN